MGKSFSSKGVYLLRFSACKHFPTVLRSYCGGDAREIQGANIAIRPYFSSAVYLG